MSSLPSEKTAIVGAAIISFCTLPSNAAVVRCTVTTSITLRRAHGLASHVDGSFQASTIGCARSASAAAITNGPPR